MSDGILVLGAGELGLAVLDALAAHPKRPATLAVLLRPSALDAAAADPERAGKISHLESSGVRLETADVATASADDLAAIMARYDTVVGCTGMALPAGTQAKLARAALEAGARRYVPWQFGMDYDAIGPGSAQDLF